MARRKLRSENKHWVDTVVKSFRLQIKGREQFVTDRLQRAMLWDEISSIIVACAHLEKPIHQREWANLFADACDVLWPSED